MRLAHFLILSACMLAGCSAGPPESGKDSGKVSTSSSNYFEPANRGDTAPRVTPVVAAAHSATPAEALAELVRAGARVSPSDRDPSQPLRIDLGAVPDPNAALQQVVLLPNVRTLHFGLNRNPLTRASYPLFDRLTNLEELNLNTTAFTDEGMPHLAGMTRLRNLVLDHDPITDAGLAPLKNLKSLEVLSLSSTEVGDTGLEVLKGMSSLTNVDLRVSRVTPMGAEQLRKALPKTKVER